MAAAALAAGLASGQCDLEQRLKVLASDGAADDLFGVSVDVSGDVAIVGAHQNDDDGSESGAAYLYDVETGAELFKLLASEASAGDWFGASVAIDGNLALVGASRDAGLRGAVYVFDVATGDELFRLLSDDGVAGDYFGYSVALSGEIAVIGARGDDDLGADSGSAYIFDLATGDQLFKLLPGDGHNGDSFGDSVAIDGDLVLVASPQDDDMGIGSGSVYVFEASTGAELHKLLASDGAEQDNFGLGTIAISGDTAVVGSLVDDDYGNGSGSAYLFDVSTGAQIAKLVPDDSEPGDLFGISADIQGDLVVVGSVFDDDNGADSGSAYFFDATDGSQLAKICPDDGEAGDAFGKSVRLDGGTLIVGAWLDDDNGTDGGSAYLFDTTPPILPLMAIQLRGRTVSGDFLDTLASDNVRWVNRPDLLSPVIVAPVRIEFEGETTRRDGSAIRAVVECRASELGIVLQLSLFNFATGQYEAAVFPNIRRVDAEYAIERIEDVSDYIGADGEIRTQVAYLRPQGFGPWTIGIDRLRFEIE